MSSFERIPFDDDDFELTPEQEAELERAIQDCNDGFTYTMIPDANGKLTKEIQCNKCNRIGELFERPFPHKLDCPMRKL